MPYPSTSTDAGPSPFAPRAAATGGVELATLIPSYQPHLHLLARLVNATVRLADDLHRVHVYALLGTDDEAADFRRRFPAQARALRFLVFADVLPQVSNLTLSQLAHRSKASASPSGGRPPCRLSRVWTGDRQTAGLKKMLGLLLLHRRGYTHAWVLDSDSAPLKPFSFAPMFAEFAARPRLLVVNFTSPHIKTIGQGNLEHFDCASKALELGRVPLLGYFNNDYWMYALELVAAMATRIERRWKLPFPLVFMRFPAMELYYYGLYAHHLAPPDQRHDAVVLPEALLSDPLAASLWQPYRWDYLRGLWCDTGRASLQQKLGVLDGPLLSWIHGYRFDIMPRRCWKHAGALIRQSSAVTWACSNFGESLPVGLELEQLASS